MNRSWNAIFNHSRKLITACGLTLNANNRRNISNKCCIFTKPRRTFYLRTYPTVVVNPNGSTYTIRYHEPRMIIKLPHNIALLSEEERKLILEKRKPKKKVVIKEELKDDFNHLDYLKLMRKQ